MELLQPSGGSKIDISICSFTRWLKMTSYLTYIPFFWKLKKKYFSHFLKKIEICGVKLPTFWKTKIAMLLRAEREARSEFFCGLRDKSQYARPDPTQPDPTRPHDAFEKLVSLELVDRFTSGLLCSMSPFNKFRIWPTPIPAGACHGTVTCRGEGVRDTIGNSTTAVPIAFKFGVCLETS